MDLAKNLKIDSVSRLNPQPPHHVPPTASVAEAVDLMQTERTGCLLVCEDNRVVGIFTERDLMKRVLAPGKPLTVAVAECMTPNPVVVRPKDPIAVAVRLMETGGYRHLPVVDEAGRAMGVLSVRRIVHYLVEHYSTAVYNLPPDPGVVPNNREGA